MGKGLIGLSGPEDSLRDAGYFDYFVALEDILC